MPEITVTPPVGGSQQDLLATALGVKFQPFDPRLAANTSAPATQTVRATALYAASGTVITGVKLRNAIAAAGTLPTTARFGLADNTGKMLALSGNLNALANWTTGVLPFPFTATFTTTYSGVYFPCFVVNGTWGSTQPTPLLAFPGGASPGQTADGANPPPVFAWAAQTDLPAVGSSLTFQASGTVYWIALY